MNKHAHVFRFPGDPMVHVIVRESIEGPMIDQKQFMSQSDAIDWLYDEHFDCVSLRIETASNEWMLL